MIWVRKSLVYVLSVVLLFALLAGATAASITIALSHPSKLEMWLAQSNLYSNFVHNAVQQANSSANNSGATSTGVSLSDIAVQQAAESAFSPALIQQDVNTFINSNYAWLEGKTATPTFSIDLSGAKESFAEKVGHYVQTYLAGLPVCTPAQAVAARATTDPLSLTCRPATLNPVSVGTQVTQQLENNTGFLSNPVITANSINPNGGTHAQPYYQKLSFAPQAYRLATRLPWELGALALLSAVGMVVIAPRRRRGLRLVGIILAEAGALLIITKFVDDALLKRVEAKAFNNATIGPLQQSLTSFAHRAETQLVDVELYFGVAFLVLAVAIFVFLTATRNRGAKLKTDTGAGADPTQSPPEVKGGPPAPSADQPAQVPSDHPKRPQRLIQ